MPRKFYFSTENRTVEYIYRADGTKLEAVYNNKVPAIAIPAAENITSDKTPLFSMSSFVKYIANAVYRSMTPDKIYFDGGYVKYSPGSKTYEYYYYIQDHLNSNRAVVKEDGTLIQAADYLASGIATSEFDGLSKDNRLHTGKEFDSMHGLNLYDNQARMYDPIYGKFTGLDPLADHPKQIAWSPYAHCANNPLRNVDPDGRFVGTVVGTIIGGISGAYNAHKSGSDIWAGAAEGIIAGAVTGGAIDLAIAATVATGGGALAVIGTGVAAGSIGGAVGNIAGDVTGQIVYQRLNETTTISTDNFANKAIDGAKGGAVSGLTGGAFSALGKAAGASTQAIQQTMSKNISSTATTLINQGASQVTVNSATSSITKGMATAGSNTVNSLIKVETVIATTTETTIKILENN